MASSLLLSTYHCGPYRLTIKNNMHYPDTSGRMAKWVVKLGEFDIQYRSRPSIKAQVLADFIVECTIANDKSKDATTKEAATPELDLRST